MNKSSWGSLVSYSYAYFTHNGFNTKLEQTAIKQSSIKRADVTNWYNIASQEWEKNVCWSFSVTKNNQNLFKDFGHVFPKMLNDRIPIMIFFFAFPNIDFSLAFIVIFFFLPETIFWLSGGFSSSLTLFVGCGFVDKSQLNKHQQLEGKFAGKIDEIEWNSLLDNVGGLWFRLYFSCFYWIKFGFVFGTISEFLISHK